MERLDARTAANRENAKKSTGPKTEEGKVRSRANAFRHGLTGQGTAWPEEDQSRLDAFVAEHVRLERPQDEHETWLVSRAAVLAWQIDRGERLEASNAHVRASTGRRRLLASREIELEQMVAQLDSNPRESVRSLLYTELGCKWVADALYDLLELLEQGLIGSGHVARIDALCGPNQPGLFFPSRPKRLALAVSGDTSAVWPKGMPARDGADAGTILDEQRPTWVAELRTILETRIAEVEGRLADLQDEPDAELEYADVLAAFDTSPVGEKLRRYLRSLIRERWSILKELAEWRAQRANVSEADPDASPEEPAQNDRSEPLAPQGLPSDWVRFAGDASRAAGPLPDAPVDAPSPPIYIEKSA